MKKNNQISLTDKNLERLLLGLVCCAMLFDGGCAKSKPVHQLQIRTMDARIAPLVSSKHSRIYHTRECSYSTSLDSLIGYPSVLDAERSGRIPCEFCSPHLYEK